jgi:hypothetical protein
MFCCPIQIVSSSEEDIVSRPLLERSQEAVVKTCKLTMNSAHWDCYGQRRCFLTQRLSRCISQWFGLCYVQRPSTGSIQQYDSPHSIKTLATRIRVSRVPPGVAVVAPLAGDLNLAPSTARNIAGPGFADYGETTTPLVAGFSRHNLSSRLPLWVLILSATRG